MIWRTMCWGILPEGERKIMDECIAQAVEAAVTMMEKGPDEAMNRFNGKRAGGEK